MGYSDEIVLREQILANVFDWKASVKMALIDTYSIDELTDARLTNSGVIQVDDSIAKKIVTVIRNPSVLAEYYDEGKTFMFVDPNAPSEIYCNIRNYVGLFAHQLTMALRENDDFLSQASPYYDALSEMLDDIRKFTNLANYLGARVNKGYDELNDKLRAYVPYRDNTRRINRKQHQYEEVDLKFLFQDFLPPEFRHTVAPWFGSF